MLSLLTLSSSSPEQAHVHTKPSRNPFPRNCSSHNVWEKSNPVFLKGEKNPSSKQGKALLHVTRQILQIAVFAGMCVSHKQGAATSAAARGSWLHRKCPVQWDWEAQGAQQPASQYNDCFSCWLLPNTTFGNILFDLLLHTQKTLFSFTPLSLVPSNTWKHISMDTFRMQVCKTALFQHHILGGMKAGAGFPSLRRGTRCWEGDRQLQRCPGFLPSSPWTHSTQQTGLTQGKESPPLPSGSTLLNHLTRALSFVLL